VTKQSPFKQFVLINQEIASGKRPRNTCTCASAGVTLVYDRQNKSPFAIALGDCFPLGTYFLASKASPNDTGIIVIVVVIIIGEAQLILHSVGIIAQTVYLDRAFLFLRGVQSGSRWQSVWSSKGKNQCKADVRLSNSIFLPI